MRTADAAPHAPPHLPCPCNARAAARCRRRIHGLAASHAGARPPGAQASSAWEFFCACRQCRVWHALGGRPWGRHPATNQRSCCCRCRRRRAAAAARREAWPPSPKHGVPRSRPTTNLNGWQTKLRNSCALCEAATIMIGCRHIAACIHPACGHVGCSACVSMQGAGVAAHAVRVGTRTEYACAHLIHPFTHAAPIHPCCSPERRGESSEFRDLTCTLGCSVGQ